MVFCIWKIVSCHWCFIWLDTKWKWVNSDIGHSYKWINTQRIEAKGHTDSYLFGNEGEKSEMIVSVEWNRRKGNRSLSRIFNFLFGSSTKRFMIWLVLIFFFVNRLESQMQLKWIFLISQFVSSRSDKTHMTLTMIESVFFFCENVWKEKTWIYFRFLHIVIQMSCKRTKIMAFWATLDQSQNIKPNFVCNIIFWINWKGSEVKCE